jgi:hypothetical protein
LSAGGVKYCGTQAAKGRTEKLRITGLVPGLQ